jgi:hypothetical protein
VRILRYVWLRCRLLLSRRGNGFHELLHWCYKPITDTLFSADEPRSGSRVSQGVTDLIDRRIQAVIEIDKSFSGPNSLTKFFPADQLARPLEEDGQNLKRLVLKTKLNTMLPQFVSDNVQFKHTKTDAFASRRRLHGKPPPDSEG